MTHLNVMYDMEKQFMNLGMELVDDDACMQLMQFV